MSLVDVTFKADFRPINRALAKIKDPKKQQDAIKKVAFGVLADVTRKTPVDTGRAKSGWNIKAVNYTLYRIGNNVYYVPYLEFGTARSRKHAGFIRGTIADWRVKAIPIIRKAMMP